MTKKTIWGLSALLLCLVVGATVTVLLVFNREEPKKVVVPVRQAKIPNIMVSSATQGPVNGKLILDIKPGQYPTVPEKMRTYNLKFPPDSTEKMQEMASRFGLTGQLQVYEKPVHENDALPIDSIDYYIAENGLHFHCYPRDGHWEFYSDNHGIEKAGPVPSAEEAEQIAVEKLSELGLLPPEYIITGVGGLYEETERDGKTIGFYTDREVTFSRKIDGYQARCTGFELRISLGENGEVTKLASSLRDPVPAGEYAMKSVEEAIDDAQNGRGTMNLHVDVKDPYVTSIQIIYYTDPAGGGSPFMQPVFLLSGPETCIYVPAIK